MDPDVKIREAVPKDAPALVEFNRSMALETEGIVLDPMTLKNGVLAVFADGDKGFYTVAESNAQRIVGGMLVGEEWSDWQNAWYWWITSVYVVPEFRKKGIYRSMYEFVKQKAKNQENVCGFRLYVDIENSAAQCVYEQAGMFASKYMMFGEDLN